MHGSKSFGKKKVEYLIRRQSYGEDKWGGGWGGELKSV